MPTNVAKQIVSALTMTAGNIPTEIVPAVAELRVPQAAKFLGMSERHLNDLLDEGVIESWQKNDTRMVSRSNLLAFEQERERGLAAMAFITQEAQEMGLYDD